MSGLRAVIRGGESLVSRKTLFSSDSKWIFVCCGNAVHMYSQRSRELVHVLAHHTALVTGIQLNANNLFQLFTVSLDGHLIVWDYTDAAVLKDIDFGTPIHNIAIRPGSHSKSLCLTLRKDGSRSECIVKCINWKSITDQTRPISPSDCLNEADILLEISSYADTVFTAEGEYLASYNKSELCIYDFTAEGLYSYTHKSKITCITSHPATRCVATGDTDGQVHLWYNVFELNSQPVTTKLHWHAHTVGSLCFTNDGTFLLSGGEESVLVLWQLDKNLSQFRPRLGASTIKQISCSPDDGCYAISLQSNIIQIISAMDLSVEYTIGGLRTAKLQLDQDGIKTGIVLQPYSQCLVMNSHPGNLQFYDIEQNKLWLEHDVTEFNYVSRTYDSALVLTTVDHVSFSTDGSWMATVESRDDPELSLDLRLKFWKFIKEDLRYQLNTCVDPPHNSLVTKLLFQPAQQSATNVTMVTTGIDGKIKTWRLQTSNGRSSWVLKSVSYHVNEPAVDAAFSEDGSLLAVTYHSCFTLWDSDTCELKTTLLPPYKTETCRYIIFGNKSSSKYLVGATEHYLTVWDLLTCSVCWCVEFSATRLISDPWSPYCAAFSQHSKCTDLYIFNPASFTPVAVYKHIIDGGLYGATFRKRQSGDVDLSTPTWFKQSELFFLSTKQILYSVDQERKAPSSNKPSIELDNRPSAFEQILGINTIQPLMKPKPSSANVPPASANATLNQLLTTPAHVLPPMTTLCSQYLTSLLPPSVSHDLPDSSSNYIHSEEFQPQRLFFNSIVETSSFGLSGEDRRDSAEAEGSTCVAKMENKMTAGVIKMDTSTEEDIGHKDESLDWLRDCFKDLLTANS